MPIDLRQQKQKLRDVMKRRRLEAQAQNPDAGLALRDVFLENVELTPHAIVGGYCAFGSEIDPMPLLESLQTLGHRLVLPVVTGKGMPLLFRGFEIGDPLAVNDLGIQEPLPTSPELDPDVVLVPLLAFDRQHFRLGYGGGFYDRTISLLRNRKPLLAIGVAFASQNVSVIPRGRLDVQLDKIVTEIQVF